MELSGKDVHLIVLILFLSQSIVLFIFKKAEIIRKLVCKYLLFSIILYGIALAFLMYDSNIKNWTPKLLSALLRVGGNGSVFGCVRVFVCVRVRVLCAYVGNGYRKNLLSNMIVF